MKILFGMYLDGVIWSNKSASIGEVRTGPLGLLNILETRLGISSLPVHPVHRIDAYMDRLKEIDHESAWFHKSFTVDSWSTARQILEWRDELVEASWQGVPMTASPRLRAITELEKVNDRFSNGQFDRLQEIIKHLKQNIPVQIASIQLMEPMELLPPGWKNVLNLLHNQRTIIHKRQVPAYLDHSTNLAFIQEILKGNICHASLSPKDDSLILLQTANEYEAAETLALWLASNHKANDQVTIICDGDSDILDQALRRHGLPRLGRSESSRWREVQQILPLMLVNAWKPVDIRLLVELLSLSTSPFPRWVRQSLLKVIAKEPGVGGRAWNKAMKSIAARYQQSLMDKGDSQAEEKTRLFIDELQNLLVEERYDPSLGIPEDQLRKRCQKVIDWLGPRLGTNALLREVVSQAREMQELSVGKDRIPRMSLERMLDSVIGAGSPAADSVEESGLWRVVDHPGQIVDSCGELVWWKFNEPANTTSTYWSEQERNNLEATGVFLERSRDFRRRENYSWQQGFLHSAKRFIAISMAQMDGVETCHHPFWDTICYTPVQKANDISEEEVLACFVKVCKDFEHQKDWEFAERKQTLKRVPHRKITEITANYAAPALAIKAPTKLSYSQMSTLIGCPMKWALQYYAGLHVAESQTIPTGNQMLGILCHRIVEELYSDSGYQWNPVDAAKEAERLYDELLPSMASELLLEGNAIEKLRCRSAVIEAIRQLVKIINQLQLKVEKTEVHLEAKFKDTPFVGDVDLLLRDAGGNPFVFDLKWSGSSKNRRMEVTEGRALQLATYAWMLNSTVNTGYFMLAQGELISDSTLLGNDAITSAYTVEETWNMGVVSLNDALKHLNEGLIQAQGIRELLIQAETGAKLEDIKTQFSERYRAQGMLYQDPPCVFCDFSLLCGREGGQI